MLNTTVIDRDYFNKVRDEIVNEKLETSELPLEIKMVISTAMVEFALNMEVRLFGKMEDE